nr:kinesin-like protein KIN-6 isoform X2 [Ipomoea batatas]
MKNAGGGELLQSSLLTPEAEEATMVARRTGKSDGEARAAEELRCCPTEGERSAEVARCSAPPRHFLASLCFVRSPATVDERRVVAASRVKRNGEEITVARSLPPANSHRRTRGRERRLRWCCPDPSSLLLLNGEEGVTRSRERPKRGEKKAATKEVYEKMVNPLVNDFIRGRSTMLAALGPSGSGKTHTIFGSGKDPSMVTLALRKLFSEEDAAKTESSRYFYLSMFEICSEKGKSEKIFDLAQDRTDLCSQQTSIKGLQEVSHYTVLFFCCNFTAFLILKY